MTIVYATCGLCEATCGLQVTVEDGAVAAIRGDVDDVFSHGFLCPKGASTGALHADPDRLRTPLVRRGGELVEASWEEAFAEIDRRLTPLLREHGGDAVGVYVGNPAMRMLPWFFYGRGLMRALRTRQLYSAGSVDAMSKYLANGLMYGGFLTMAIPDVDRTDHMLILGADPASSNGSFLTAPDMRGRLRAIQQRGGKVVVIDPRRNRTAERADEHHFIRPGTDAMLLFAIAHVLFAEGLTPARNPLLDHVEGVETVRELAREFPPERVAPACGISAPEIERIARELAAAPRAVVYGRVGTCTQEFGTLASWLVDVLNVLTGNLDRPGGAMFPRAAAGQPNAAGLPGRGRGVAIGRWRTRVRGLPEVWSELPLACLAEEIDTPGEGQLRALITIAGNPACSAPNAERLSAALEQLELMVSLDIYVNETTRFADVVLPGPVPLQRPHYDAVLYQLATRNVANFSPAVVEPEPGLREDWETLLRLTAIAAGHGPAADIDELDRALAVRSVEREVASEHSPIAGRDPREILAALEGRRGPLRMLDLMLRVGAYGDAFGARPDGLSLAVLEAAPHGIDLGPLEPRVPELLRTPSGKIELAPPQIIADVPRLRAAIESRADGGMVLIGRRQMRSNNSWMHNLLPLVRGKDRCTALVHPDDAARVGLEDGGRARISSRAGTIEIPIEITDEVMPGVVSIPHGWGHDVAGVRMRVASAHAGVNSNLLSDDELVDAPSGNAVLNGIPVELAAAE